MTVLRNAVLSAGLVLLMSADPAAVLKAEEKLPTIKNSVGMQLVLIPAGEFPMGSSSEDIEKMKASGSRPSRNELENEQPQHRVKISKPFYLGQTEVTQEQWKTVMETVPWERGFLFKGDQWVREGPNFPAVFISWENAQKFCEALTERERLNGGLAPTQKYRLPTEAEWEYACRAGTTTTYSYGDDPSALSEYGWWGAKTSLDSNAKDEKYAHEVAQKAANPWGLYDMHGNVFEWCQDGYDKSAYKSRQGLTIDPVGTDSSVRCLRSGSWIGQGWITRCAMRSGGSTDANVAVGLRVARTE